MAGSLAALAAAELDLQHLAAEALRALPAVKDVAERVVFELRGLQQVSRASGGSGELAGAALASLKAQWLHPFLIACNHTGAPKRVLTIALGALQRLITSDGVAPGDMLGIARVLEIQAESSEEDIRLKVLQTLPLLLSQPTFAPDSRLLSAVCALCFAFLKDKSSVLKHAASATLQQAVALMFERAERVLRDKATLSVAEAEGMEGGVGGDATEAITRGGRVAAPAVGAAAPSPAAAAPNPCVLVTACRLFLQDMVLVAGGLPTQWMRRGTPVPRVLACDLIDYALRDHARLFILLPAFCAMAGKLLIPLLLRQLPSQLSFPLLLRFCRITRSVLTMLHALIPGPCRALLSLLVRCVHACAKGEDLGADSAQKLGRWGAAGARILRGAHRALAAQPGGGGAPNDETDVSPSGRRVPVAPAAPAAPMSGGEDAEDAALMAAVAAIPLGAMPLFKAALILETLHGVVTRPGVATSLYATFDLQSGSVGGGGVTSPRAVCVHLLDSLWMLVYRLLVIDAAGGVGGAGGGGGGGVGGSTGGEELGENNFQRQRESSFSASGYAFSGFAPPRRRAAARAFVRRSESGVEFGGGAGASNAVLPATPSALEDVIGSELLPAGSSGGANNHAEPGDGSSDEFTVWPGDLEAAVEGHARRPLVALSCPDADAHIFSSSAGGLAAAVAFSAAAHSAPAAGAGSASGSGGGLSAAAATLGAAFSLVSAGSSLLFSSPFAGSSKAAPDKAASGGVTADDAALLAAAAAAGGDVVSPPSGFLAATLAVLALECAAAYVAAGASGAASVCRVAGASGTGHIDRMLPLLQLDVSTTGGGIGDMNGADAPRSRPLLLSPPPALRGSAIAAALAAAAASSASFSSGLADGGGGASPPIEDATVPIMAAAAAASTAASTSTVPLALHLISACHRPTTQMLVLVFESVGEGSTSGGVVNGGAGSTAAYCVKALQSLCFSAGALGLVPPRDAVLVQLIRMSLGSLWAPPASVAALAHSIGGGSSSGGGEAGAKSSELGGQVIRGGGSSSAYSRSAAASLPWATPPPSSGRGSYQFRTGMGSGGGGGSFDASSGSGGTLLLAPRRTLAQRSVLNLTHSLGCVLGNTWILILDALEQLAAVRHAEAVAIALGAGLGGEDAEEMSTAAVGVLIGPPVSLLGRLRDQQFVTSQAAAASASAPLRALPIPSIATNPTVEAALAAPPRPAQIVSSLAGLPSASIDLNAKSHLGAAAATAGARLPLGLSSVSYSLELPSLEEEGGQHSPLSSSATGRHRAPSMSLGDASSSSFLTPRKKQFGTATDVTPTSFVAAMTAASTVRDSDEDAEGKHGGPETAVSLAPALALVFSASSLLPPAALGSLVQALSELTISAFAEAASAEMNALEEREAAGFNDGISVGGPPGSNASALRNGKSARVGGRQLHALSPEAQAAMEAHEIMQNAAEEAAAAATAAGANGAWLPPPSSTPSPQSTGAQPPFALSRLLDCVCTANVHRLGTIWPAVSALLRVLARSRGASIRSCGASALAELAIAHLLHMGQSSRAIATSEEAVRLSPAALLSPLVDFWRSPYADARADALRGLYRVTEEAGTTLKGDAGSNTSGADGWCVIVGVLYCVSCLVVGVDAGLLPTLGDAPPSARKAVSPPAAGSPDSPPLYLARLPACLFESPDRAGSSLYSGRGPLLAEAFRLSQLITDDFAQELPPSAASLLLLALGLAARQHGDLNAALASVNLLWKLGDCFAARAENLIATSIGSGAKGKTQIAATPNPSTAVNSISTPALSNMVLLDRREYTSLWEQLFCSLLTLSNGSEVLAMPQQQGSFSSGDSAPTASEIAVISASLCDVPVQAARPEVRNSAVQALFACLSSQGTRGTMGATQWQALFFDRALPLLEQLTTVAHINLAEDSAIVGETVGKRRGGGTSGDGVSNGSAQAQGGVEGDDDAGGSATVRLRLHHSRDTVGKQWNETRVIAYQGLTRTTSACFSALLSFPWFPDAWGMLLAILERSISGVCLRLGTPASSKLHHASPAEPLEVSVAAMACLQELALLVAVPSGPGRPADDEERYYSFDMRVVDGALVRVPGVLDPESGSNTVAPPRQVTKASVAPAAVMDFACSSQSQALRASLWSNTFAVFSAVGASTNVFCDEEEVLAAAVVDALTAVATAVVIPTGSGSPTPSSFTVADTSVLCCTERFSDCLALMWRVLTTRRQHRWAATNSLSLNGGSGPRVVLAEQLSGPRTEISTSCERVFLRGLERVFGALRVVQASRAVFLSSAGAPPETLVAAWSAALDLLRRAACLDDSDFASQFVKDGNTASSGLPPVTGSSAVLVELSLPPATLATHAVKLLTKLYANRGALEPAPSANGVASAAAPPIPAPSSIASSTTPAIPASATACEADARAIADAAFHRAFPSLIPVLAQALLRARDCADRVTMVLENADARRAAAISARASGARSGGSASTQQPPLRAGTSLLLEDACARAGLGVVPAAIAAGEAPLRAPTSSHKAGGAPVAEVVYPVKIWGFGLGGSYGLKGDGSLEVTDSGKSKRTEDRARKHADALMAALVAIVRQRILMTTTVTGGGVVAGGAVAVGGGGSASSVALPPSTMQAVDIWLSLQATLEVLTGFGPAAGAMGVSQGGKGSAWGGSSSSAVAHQGGGSTASGGTVAKRGPTDPLTSIARFFEALTDVIDTRVALVASGVYGRPLPGGGAEGMDALTPVFLGGGAGFAGGRGRNSRSVSVGAGSDEALPSEHGGASVTPRHAAALFFDAHASVDGGLWAAVRRAESATAAVFSEGDGGGARVRRAVGAPMGGAKAVAKAEPKGAPPTPPPPPPTEANRLPPSVFALRGAVGRSAPPLLPLATAAAVLASPGFAAAVAFQGWTALRSRRPPSAVLEQDSALPRPVPPTDGDFPAAPHGATVVNTSGSGAITTGSLSAFVVGASPPMPSSAPPSASARSAARATASPALSSPSSTAHLTPFAAAPTAPCALELLEPELFLLRALLAGHAALAASDANCGTHGFIALTRRLFGLLAAGVAALGVNGWLPLPASTAAASFSSSASEHSPHPPAAAAPPISVEVERRRRAFGCVCFDALVGLAGVQLGGPLVQAPALVAEGASGKAGSSGGGRSGGASSRSLAASVRAECRAFARRMLLHASAATLQLITASEAAAVVAAHSERVREGGGSAGGGGLLPSALVIDALFALQAMGALLLVPSGGGDGGGDALLVLRGEEELLKEVRPEAADHAGSGGAEDPLALLLGGAAACGDATDGGAHASLRGGLGGTTLQFAFRVVLGVSVSTEPLLRVVAASLLRRISARAFDALKV